MDPVRTVNDSTPQGLNGFLGSHLIRGLHPRILIFDPYRGQASPVVQTAIEKPVTLVAPAGPDGEVDYSPLDRPTVIRNKMAGERYATGTDGNLDYLDIPAFLRRQAD